MAKGQLIAPIASFLVPVFNGGSLIDRALSSAAGQDTHGVPYDIVVVNDGSTDPTTLGALRQWADHPRVTILDRAHGGIVAALNEGVPRCAPIILRLDADDIAHPRRLVEQTTALSENPDLDAVSSLVDLIDRDATPSNRGMAHYIDWLNALVTDNQIRSQRFVESPLIHTSVAIRRDVLIELGMYREEPSPEDYDLWLRFLARGHRVRKLERVLTSISDRPDRLTRNDPRCSRDAFEDCKAHHLGAACSPGAPLLIWGAGTSGKRWLRRLRSLGYTIRCVADNKASRHGATIADTPCVSPARLAEIRATEFPTQPVLVTVAGHGALEDVRATLLAMGWHEGVDFFRLAGTRLLDTPTRALGASSL